MNFQIHSFFRDAREFAAGSEDPHGNKIPNPGPATLKNFKSRVEEKMGAEIPKMSNTTFYRLLRRMKFRLAVCLAIWLLWLFRLFWLFVYFGGSGCCGYCGYFGYLAIVATSSILAIRLFRL